MSDREVILRALKEVQRRFRLNRLLRESAVVSGMIATGLLLWRLLDLIGGRAPAATALSVLGALMLWVAGCGLLLRGRLGSDLSLAAAAATLDRRGALRDEIGTAAWFLLELDGRRFDASQWVRAQVAQAAHRARGVDPARLIPIRLERRALVAGGLVALLLAAAWIVPSALTPRDALASRASALADLQAGQLRELRELMAKTPDESLAAKLEQAVKALERKDAGNDEKRRALAAAQQAIDQQNLQAASTREGLFRAAQRLQRDSALQDVAQALSEGDAGKAADLLRRIAPAGNVSSADLSQQGADAPRGDQDLGALLREAAKAGAQEARTDTPGAAAREAIDRLKQITEQLESQAQLARAAQALQQMQLAVAQRSQMAAGRFGQEAAQSSSPSPDTGQTSMPGGKMFRSAAVAQASRATSEQEGSKTGNAMGDAEAEQVLGSRVTPLAAQLKREGIGGEREDDGGPRERDWFYSESKEQRSGLEIEAAQTRHSFAQADLIGGEGIALRHRGIVKDYFIHLREGEK